ncbi:hypothetical protein J7L67_04615 [bacterium]|nr:hypothetical protein [bacterium]
MIFKPKKDIPEFIKKLNDQKSLYREMLNLSCEEKNILANKPLRLNNVIELLYQKEQLLSKVQGIEKDIAPFRNVIEQMELDNVYQATIDCCAKEIGELLEQLVLTDTQNEQVLQGTVVAKPSFFANPKNAVNAYKTFSR